jgi:putative peptidoglycan lipid II flippase
MGEAAAIFQRGRFTHQDAVYVWAILAGSALGLLSSALGRLYSDGFYALGDTRRPLGFALIRVSLVATLGYLCALPLPRALGVDLRWGAAGLTASAGLAGWVEFLLLRRGLSRRIGAIALPVRALVRIWAAAGLAAAVATAARLISPPGRPVVEGVLVVGAYGVVFLGVAHLLGVREVGQVLRRLKARQ